MSENITPAYREEKLLANIAGGDYEITPATRKEKLLAEIQGLPDTTGAQEGDVLVIGSDGPEWARVPGAIEEVTVETAGAVTQELDAGKIYHFTGALTALTITLTAPASGQVASYHFDFLSGSTAPTLTMPNTVTMPDSFTVEADNRYEVDILNGYGVAMAWTIS